jgi:anti-sigma factor RsiW
MSKCQDLDPLFAPYADGQSPPADRASVEAHLERCPPCRQRVAEQRTVRAAIAACRPALRAPASETLRARCADHARPVALPPASTSRLSGVRRWAPLSLAATLLLAVAGAFFLGLNNKVQALAAQLTLDHVTCFQFAPERLGHADAAAAAREWTARQGWAIQIPASSAREGLELLGIRRCAMSSGRVAHVMYKWKGEPLSVFVVPRPLRRMRDPQEMVEKFGHEAVMWTDRDRTYVILARARPAELAPVVGYVRQNAH